MQLARRFVLLGAVGLLVLAGCLPTPAAPGAQEPAPSVRLSPTDSAATPPSILPDITFSDIALVQGDLPDEWLVFGLARNDSRYALESVVLRVELLDPAGSPIMATSVELPLSILQPEATSPFMARAELTGTPQGARASLEAFQFSSEAPANVRALTVRTIQTAGGVFVLGTVQGQGSSPLQVHDVVVTWRDARRSLTGLAIASVPGAQLAADGNLPWVAEVPSATPQTRFEVFAAAAAIDHAIASPLETSAGPTWRVTAQGRGFATGAIRNAGDTAILPEVTIAVKVAGRLASLEILQSNIPMQPGETLTFAADAFPGLEASLDSEADGASDVSMELFVAAYPVPPGTEAAVLLPVSVKQFEAIGSSLFLKGTVSNPGSTTLRTATVYISLRSTNGEPQAARWLEVAPPPAGASTEFSVDLPIAAGIDPAMSEYDVRALGLPLPDPSW